MKRGENLNKEKKLEEIQKKIDSMHIEVRFIIEQLGAMFTFFCIYAPAIAYKLYNPGYINNIAAHLLILPALVIAAVAPNLLAAHRGDKLKELERELKTLKIEVIQEKVKQKISDMSHEEKLMFLKGIVLSEELPYGLDSKTFNEIIFKIMKEIDKENNKNFSVEDKPQTIGPIDRTYEETTNYNHTKKLHI